MTRRTLDLTSLVAGFALMGLGAGLLLDRLDVLDLRFGYLWPALLAVLGAILVAAGLGHQERE